MTVKSLEKLTSALFQSVAEHYGTDEPPSPEKVFDVLGALAIVTATTIAGCEGPREQEAKDFFKEAARKWRIILEETEKQKREPRPLQ